MKLVRLYISHNNHRSFVDVPYGEHLETKAGLEIKGVEVYHAAVMDPIRPVRKAGRAKLQKRRY
jgi:hypothetical protein